MNRRVLIVHNDYRLSGGESIVVAGDAAMLRLNGDAVTQYRRDNHEIPDGFSLKKLALAFGTLFSFRTYRAVRALIRENRIQTVHVHNTVPLISPAVYYAAWAEGVPVVQTLHNYRFLCPNGVFYRDGHICEECVKQGLGRAVRHGCYRHSRAQSALLASCIGLHRLLGTYRRIEAYLCPSPFAKEKLAQKLPAERITVKLNTVSVDCEKIPYDRHDGGYVFAGRLDGEKGVWVLLNAFIMLPGERLTIIGGGPEEAAMREFIAARSLSNVAMTGQLPHEEALLLMARAKACIMPTQMYEGALPLTVLEPMALGTPVIGSEIGCVAAIREIGCGFTFDQTDPEALADCIRNLTEEMLFRAAERALAAGEVYCDTARSYRELCAVYDAAAERAQVARTRRTRN